MEPISVQELYLREIAAVVLPGEAVLYNHRPPWIRNPKTDNRLELDIFYPSIGFALEYNGWQHNTVNDAQGVGVKAVRYQMLKDAAKYRQAAKYGVHLHVVTIRELSDRASLMGMLRDWADRARHGVKPEPAQVAPLMEWRDGKVKPWKATARPRMVKQAPKGRQRHVPSAMHELSPYELEYLAARKVPKPGNKHRYWESKERRRAKSSAKSAEPKGRVTPKGQDRGTG